MKRDQREREIERLRRASLEWQDADKALQGMSRARERVDRFIDAVIGENHQPIQSVEAVPDVLRAAWLKSGEGLPDFATVLRRLEYRQAASRWRAARAAIYTPEFVAAMGALRARRADGVDVALTWLEANPLCFRSGYDKQRLMRYLRHVPLTLDQQRQLRAVLLNAVREGAGEEIREYCRTARIVDTRRFRRALAAIRDDAAGEHWSRQRATWMLEALIRTNGE